MAITLDVSVGDTILGGRFKNKKIKVKKIGKDEHGMPTINGRKVVNFRILKVDEKIIRDKDGYGKYEKPDDSDFDEPSKTKNESNYKNDGDNKMIIEWIKSLFHKKPDEILKLKEVIDKVNSEKEQLQSDLDKLLKRKRINKKVVANAKRKLTRTKNEIKKMTEVFDKEDIDDAVKFLRKFSK